MKNLEALPYHIFQYSADLSPNPPFGQCNEWLSRPIFFSVFFTQPPPPPAATATAATPSPSPPPAPSPPHAAAAPPPPPPSAAPPPPTAAPQVFYRAAGWPSTPIQSVSRAYLHTLQFFYNLLTCWSGNK